MASFDRTIDGISDICNGNFDIANSCTHRIIIDFINISFISVLFLYLILNYIKNHNIIIRCDRREKITLATTICCTITSILYLTSSLYVLVCENNHSSLWLVTFFRGLVWIFLIVTLLIQGSKTVKILISIWWVVFFLLISSLNVEIILKIHKIQIPELVAWVANLFLFICGLRYFSNQICVSNANTNLSDPLLAKDSEKNQCRISQASFLSKLTFSWTNHLLRLGYSKILAREDIPNLVPEDESNLAHERFSRAWEALLRERNEKNTRNLVFWALFNVYKKEMAIIGMCALFRSLCVVVAPLLLYAFVNFSNRKSNSVTEGLYLVCCLVIVKIVESLSQRHFYFYSKRIGMRMRSALMVATYRKELMISHSGKQRHSTGDIVNYIAVDAYRMSEYPQWFHLGWSFCFQLFSAIVVLFSIVGLGALLGLIPLLICGLLNVPFAKFLQKCQFQFMVAQDNRIRATSATLNSMKIIKLQSWEGKFRDTIDSYRDNEFKWLAKSQTIKAFGTALYWMSPTVVSAVVFYGCVFFESVDLNAATIFTVLASLRSMAEPVRMIPEALSALIQVKVSFDRIETFLLEDEVPSDKLMTCPRVDSDRCVEIRDGNFSWEPESVDSTLKNIELEVKRGEKIAVCGPVGAGKSSLLYAILGEIPKSSGNVNVLGSIAYMAQSSWIRSGTVRENILNEKPMESTKYEKAIKACALDKDIASFSHGDLTEIGQRGLNMSGGQKQRIQLARAVYNDDADIYLLDDPFSVVDAHTAATLFHDCVMEALRDKTVILVTHQVEFLSEVDKILVMEDGKVTQCGSYNELLTKATPFEKLVNAHRDAITIQDPKTSHKNDEDQETNKSHYITKQESEGEIVFKLGQLTEEEEREFGDVGWKPFFDYLYVSKGWLFFSLSIISQSAFVTLQAGASYWLAYGIQVPDLSSGKLIGVYTLISSSSALFVYLRSLFTAFLGLKASKAFFFSFIDSIFNAPMLFFDSTPVGRILTRASSDLCILDFDIPFSLSFVYAPAIELIGIIGIMSYVTWQVLIFGVFAIVASKYVQGYYQATARELMRINGTTKAPVVNYATETSLGVVTIRAFKLTDSFFQNYLKLIDTDAKLFLYSNATLEWLIIRVEALQNLTLFAAAFLLVLLPKGFVAPGLIGLSFSYALALTSTQIFMTRWYSNFCNYIISVERIKQFMHISPEPPAVIDDKRPPYPWPSKGRIELKDLKIRYRPNAPLVLKGISCTFIEGKKVGVVGRTGSGKTTLISALFRLVDPYNGKIIIDDIDICSIGLKDLRIKLSIIPQEPTLFKGSVRTNLDPLGLYSDDDIWKALEKCQLKSTISSLPNLLDSSVSDEGENWSAGQKQLFCLGRVLLKRNKILVLDEATASIDSATDVILQRIIREEFSDCTVITVAHRVPTVIDSDMVMVLSFGKLIEYDEPSKLMGTNSAFSKLVAEYWSSCRRNSSYNF